MADIIQNKEELDQHLREQLSFLKRSSEAYDQGYKDEAKRLAVTIRVLFHDTKNSKSLLGLLGMKKSIRFFDTAPDYDPDDLAPFNGLTFMKFTSSGGEFLPRAILPATERKYNLLISDNWWNKIVIVDTNKKKFTRRDLVLSVANRDGGAHVDSSLNADYVNLTRNNPMGWIMNKGNAHIPIRLIELASIRQIAFEIVLSFEQQDSVNRNFL